MGKICHIRDALIDVAYKQLDCLSQVNTKEMGEVIDMIKDLEEAMYYAKVTEAMEHKKEEEEEQEEMPRILYYYDKYLKETDKAQSMSYLQSYVQALTEDVHKMLSSAAPEEKAYLSNSMTSLGAAIIKK